MTAAIKITVSALIVVLFAFSLLFVGLRAMGLATFVVTGASMEPTIHKGSLVIDEPVTADKLRLGDVIILLPVLEPARREGPQPSKSGVERRLVYLRASSPGRGSRGRCSVPNTRAQAIESRRPRNREVLPVPFR